MIFWYIPKAIYFRTYLIAFVYTKAQKIVRIFRAFSISHKHKALSLDADKNSDGKIRNFFAAVRKIIIQLGSKADFFHQFLDFILIKDKELVYILKNLLLAMVKNDIGLVNCADIILGRRFAYPRKVQF